MRQYIVTLLAVLLVACGDNPTDPPEEPANQLRVINGPATCDACEDVEFTVAGPGLNKVIDALEAPWDRRRDRDQRGNPALRWRLRCRLE